MFVASVATIFFASLPILAGPRAALTFLGKGRPKPHHLAALYCELTLAFLLLLCSCIARFGSIPLFRAHDQA